MKLFSFLIDHAVLIGATLALLVYTGLTVREAWLGVTAVQYGLSVTYAILGSVALAVVWMIVHLLVLEYPRRASPQHTHSR